MTSQQTLIIRMKMLISAQSFYPHAVARFHRVAITIIYVIV